MYIKIRVLLRRSDTTQLSTQKLQTSVTQNRYLVVHLDYQIPPNFFVTLHQLG